MNTSTRDVGVIWCSNQRSGRANRWSFPPNVERHLRNMVEGKRVYHPFGGMARFGLRGDIDPIVKPEATK